MKVKTLFSILLFTFTIVFSTNIFSQNFKFINTGHIEVLGTYSDIKKGEALWGYNIFGYICPSLKIDPTLYLIPLYTLEYKRLRQFISEEEGIVQYTNYLTHNLTLGLRKEFKKNWFIKISTLGTWNYVKETKDEDWGEGLYDYRDAGVSLDFRHRIRTEKTFENYTWGFEYFRRKYPNFQSLLSIGMPSAPEKNEKDFDGYKFSFGWERATSEGLKFYIKPYLLLKFFLDKHLLNEDGTLNSSKKRKDTLLNLDWGISFPLTEKIRFFLDNNYSYNYSKLGYYDSKNTLILTDDKFIPRYYYYQSFLISPSLEYIYPLEGEKEISLKLGFSFLYKDYFDRKAQTESGTYSQKDQRDLEYELSAALSFPITKKLNWLIRYSYTWARSNQRYEAYYRYNYDTYLIEAGFSLNF
ncbi:MAG: hypothetical protein DRP61_02720 [Candidatus Omnitrophota bacterium]|nr:MAG: hypothetical protein DRP61_02720 [Candidatus Omnitrophota bacterium]